MNFFVRALNLDCEVPFLATWVRYFPSNWDALHLVEKHWKVFILNNNACCKERMSVIGWWFSVSVSDWWIRFKGGFEGGSVSPKLSSLRSASVAASTHSFTTACDVTPRRSLEYLRSWQVTDFTRNATPSGFPKSRGHRGSGQCLLPWLWD